MRGMIEGAPSLQPVVENLPGVYQDNDFLQRFLAAFDDGLAPIFLTLDGLPAYLDPELAPADFVEWLFSWVGIEPDDRWSVELRRQILSGAVPFHGRRGTVRGVADVVRLAVGGGGVEVTDSGGTSWSRVPDSPMPGDPMARLSVRVTARRPEAVNVRRLERVVASATPAHVVHSIQVRGVADPGLR